MGTDTHVQCTCAINVMNINYRNWGLTHNLKWGLEYTHTPA